MASKRNESLDPTVVRTGKFIAIDNNSQGESESFPADSLLGVDDIRVGSSSLSVGANVVLFTDIGTTSYEVLQNTADASGTVSCLISNKLTDRFTATVAYAATITFVILKT